MFERGSLSETEQQVLDAVSFALNPVGYAAKTIGSEIIDKINAPERNEAQMAYNDPYSSGTGSFGTPNTASMSRGGGGIFGNFGQTIRDLGGGISDLFSDAQPIFDVFGAKNPIQRTNAGTATTIIRQAPDEQASSGELMGANLGLAGPLMQAGRQLFRSPGGQTALGFGAGALGAALTPSGSGAPRITRKMKSDVRRIYMMAGMDPNVTAQILNNMGTYPRMNFDASLVFFILTKRFRNDGPVVTKAAVRKTKTTLRRMKGVVDMYNSVCKPTTRRAPARRAAPKAVQLIKN